MPNKRLVFFLVAIWLSQVQAEVSSKASNGKAKEKNQQTVHGEQEKAKVITNQEASKLYEKYLDGWKAISDEQRTKITAEVIAENVQYSTPRHELGRRETMIDDMAEFQKKFPNRILKNGD